ncbi:hypothetical protein Bca101_098608 [Brassica carinata]
MGRHDSSSEEDERVRRSDRERGRRGSTRVTADKPTSDDRQKSSRESERKRRDNEERSQGDKLRKEEKSGVTKPKLPELNPSDSNAKAWGKTGGVYIPPFKLARMMKEVDDKSSVEYQRLTWDALRKSINGLVNKVNASNIKNIIPELFAENLIRGRGLFCRSCMKSQMASPGFTDVFAALVAVINAKFPEVAELRFRGILHEGDIDKRVQYLIEGLFATRKAKFQGHPAVRPELDLVEDKYSHDVSLNDEIVPETSLDVFKPDPDFIENEKKYEALKKELLGEDESEDEDGSDASSEDYDEEEEDESGEEQMRIRDETETNLVNLRRTIYLTIMSSVDFEEAGHKLLKIKLEPGQEMELCIMLLECCSQERTYLRYYGLLGQRFCMINKIHQENFEKCFVQQYSMIHRLETNKLRNELSEHLGIRLLNERLQDPTMQESLESIFPKDNPKNTRFAINFFTSIGLGGITESLREYLKNMPRLIMQQQKQVAKSESGSDSSDSDSDSSSSSSSSDESDRETRKRRRRRS